MTPGLRRRVIGPGLRPTVVAVLLGSALGCATAGLDQRLPPRMLARAPLCEASAAEIAPWDPAQVLVGDNEVDGAVFALRRDPSGWLTSLERLRLPAGVTVDDIEALAAVDGRLVVVGSHGRSARCERRPSREHLAVVEWHPDHGGLELVSWTDATAAVDTALQGVDACLDALFVSPPPDGARAFCERLHVLEAGLARGHCTPPLDIEAAVAVPGAEGDRVWLGLRQPRVAGRPTLLRLVPELQTLRFDAVAWLDAGDRGLRAATSTGDELWFVLGPGPPTFDGSTLWRSRADALQPAALLAGEVVVDGLLPESEGLVVVDGVVTIVIDGDEAPEEAAACSEPALQQLIRLRPR